MLFTLGIEIHRSVLIWVSYASSPLRRHKHINTGNDPLSHSLITCIQLASSCTLCPELILDSMVSSPWRCTKLALDTLPHVKAAHTDILPLSASVSLICSCPRQHTSEEATRQLYRSSQPDILATLFQLRPHHCITILFCHQCPWHAPTFVVLLTSFITTESTFSNCN